MTIELIDRSNGLQLNRLTDFAGIMVAAFLAMNLAAPPLGFAEESVSKLAASANEAIAAGDYETAIKKIDEALLVGDANQPDARLNFNKAIALYRMGDVDSARDLFSKVAGSAPPKLASKARFNLGNVDYARAIQNAEQDKQSAISQLKSAIKHYRASLRTDSSDAEAGDAEAGDVDARANIELAYRLIKQLEREEDQQEQEQQKDDERKEKNEDQKNEEKQNQEKQNSDQEEKDSNKGDEKQNEKGEDKKDQGAESDEKNSGEEAGDKQESEQKENGSDNDSDKDKSEQDPANSDEDGDSQKSDSEKPAPKDEQSSDQDQGSKSEKSNKANQQPKSQPNNSPSDDAQNENKQEEASKDKKQPPEGELEALNEQTKNHGPAQPGEGMTGGLKEGQTMTMQEARKMLQAVRDRELRRRIEKLQKMRVRRVPVEKDW